MMMMMRSCLHSLLIPLELHMYLYDTHMRVRVCVYTMNPHTHYIDSEIFPNDSRMWNKS
jgi:hypothetical protein